MSAALANRQRSKGFWLRLDGVPRLLPAALTALALIVPAPPATAAQTRKLPSESVWLADVHADMVGSRAFLADRVASAVAGERLAINLDIDNTSLATHYAPQQPVRVVRRFARFAHRHGVAVFFNTGRDDTEAAKMQRLLGKAGFPVDRVCTRHVDEDVVVSKQRCRQSFVDSGFTVVANVGNRSTDFVGSDYERAFRLPSYGNKLS